MPATAAKCFTNVEVNINGVLQMVLQQLISNLTEYDSTVYAYLHKINGFYSDTN